MISNVNFAPPFPGFAHTVLPLFIVDSEDHISQSAGNATLFGRSLEVSLSPVWAQVALGCLHDGNGLLIPEQWEADSLGGHWFR